MSKSLSYFKAVTFCLLHFALKTLFHFALKSCYILRQKLLHFGLMLHFASIVTFCGVTRPWFQEHFYLQIKNPPTSENTTVDNLFRWLFYGKKVEVKRRPRSFAPTQFSLTITLSILYDLGLFAERFRR